MSPADPRIPALPPDELSQEQAAQLGGFASMSFPRVMVRDQRVGDETWKRLAQRYSQIELMEVVGLVGCYVMMAMFTKSYGIELEDEDTFNAFAQQRQYT